MKIAIAISAVALATWTGFVPTLSAQDGTAAPPPTYDYDPATPGTQGPKSPLVAGFTYRSVRTYQIAVPATVPLTDLQAILPAGFTAIATPAGSTSTTVTLNFFLDQRFQPDVTSQTTYGPTSALLVTATVLNSNTATPRQEIVFPCFEASGDTDQLNSVFGAGSARAAQVTASVKEEIGSLKFKFSIRDFGIGMDLTMSAEAADTVNTRAVSDPVAFPFRAFNGLVANSAFFAASQSDTLAVPVANANFSLRAPGQRLYFPAGALNILGYGANLTFSRNVEFIIKFE